MISGDTVEITLGVRGNRLSVPAWDKRCDIFDEEAEERTGICT